MLLFSIILLLTAALFAVMGICIYNGKTDLIHSYHQSKVADKRAYGKAFGKAMAVIAYFMALSGIAALFGDSAPVVWLSMGFLFGGLTIGLVCIFHVQKKYNGGVF